LPIRCNYGRTGTGFQPVGNIIMRRSGTGIFLVGGMLTGCVRV
jgi:hypothetical protein